MNSTTDNTEGGDRLLTWILDVIEHPDRYTDIQLEQAFWLRELYKHTLKTEISSDPSPNEARAGLDWRGAYGKKKVETYE